VPFTPARYRGVEILDDPAVDSALRERSISDVVRSNRLLGGTRASLTAVLAAIAELGSPATYTLLDVGTGLGDIPDAVARSARRTGVQLVTIGLDEAPGLLRAGRSRLTHVACGGALALPFADRSVDLVTCSQLLHHFERDDAERLIGEMNRVARHAVVVSDLRRSWVAAAGFWLVAFILRFHPVTRHDGVVSVRRGFTPAELRDMIETATGVAPIVRCRLGYRVTARWQPLRESR
jgi:ubiquinone/menaquinone biosynthesis C-methylase UbiE